MCQPRCRSTSNSVSGLNIEMAYGKQSQPQTLAGRAARLSIITAAEWRDVHVSPEVLRNLRRSKTAVQQGKLPCWRRLCRRIAEYMEDYWINTGWEIWRLKFLMAVINTLHTTRHSRCRSITTRTPNKVAPAHLGDMSGDERYRQSAKHWKNGQLMNALIMFTL